MIGALADSTVIDLELRGRDAAALAAIAESARHMSGASGAAMCLIGRDIPVCVAGAGPGRAEAKEKAAQECLRLRGLQLAQLRDQAVRLDKPAFDATAGFFPFFADNGACLGALVMHGLYGPLTAERAELVSGLVGAIPTLLMKAGIDHQMSTDRQSAQSESLHMILSSLPDGLHGTRSAEEKLAVLMATARDIMSVRSIETLQWHVAEDVVGKLGFLDCIIYRYDAATATLHQSAAIGAKTPERGVIINPLIIPLNRGITGAVASTREPLLLENAGDDPRYVHDLMEPGSELCVPILYDDRLLGVIDCEHPEKGWFTPEDMQMLTAVASLMASQWIQCELTGAIRENAKRLEKAERAAAAANQAKSVFVANMSHEIRTPLHGVLGAAQLLARSKLDERQGRFIEIIQSAGQTLLSIIEEILDISHIETGSICWTKKSFDLSATTLSVSAGISILAKQKGLEFGIEMADDLPAWVIGDPKRYGQILTNFLGNAVKYTDAGQVVLKMSRAEDGFLRIAVRDTGPGLNEEECSRVFERFSRLDEQQSGAQGGAGLGLSICKEFARIAGGRIGVDSIKGEGSCFWCELPMPAVDVPEGDAVPPPEFVEPLQAANDRVSRTVLVVDDAETNRLVVREYLEEAGYEVLCAVNGADAVEVVRRGACDAVLMDIRMPVLRGDTAISRIRKLSGPERNVPIFAVTGDATPDARRDVRRIGADAFFTKPLNLADVRATLDSVLRGMRPQ